MSKNICNCKNQNFTAAGDKPAFKLFTIFDRKYVPEKVNPRTEIITKSSRLNFPINVDRISCISCDATKQQKLELRKKPTPFRMPYNHYRKQSTCRTDCMENVKVIKETVDPCECPKSLITSRLIGKTGVRFINETTYKNYLQRNGMLYSQNSEGILNENKVSGNEYKIGQLESMVYNKNTNSNIKDPILNPTGTSDPNCMIYRKKPTSLTEISFSIKKIPTTTRKYSNAKYGRNGSVSSRSRVHRLKYQTKMSSQINYNQLNTYNNCINGEICSRYKNPGPNIKENKNTPVECIPSRSKRQTKLRCHNLDIIIPPEDPKSKFYFRTTFPSSSTLEKLTGDYNILYNIDTHVEPISKFYFRTTFPSSSTLEKLTGDYNIIYNLKL